jgi:argininosuccinate synthase
MREEFARDFVLPALRAGALCKGRYPVGQALAWPLIARTLVDIASVERATAVAHCCTGRDQASIGACVAALDPVIHVMSVGSGNGAQLGHANLWGWPGAVDVRRSEAPISPAYVDVAFEQGIPVAINGVRMPLIELIESLSVIAGQHGVGWIQAGRSETGRPGDHAYEAPAAVVLHAALRALDAAVLPPDLLRLKQDRAIAYEHLVSEGLWFTEDREMMDALNVKTEEKVTGSVRITLFKGMLLTSDVVGVGQAEVSRA